MPSHYLKRSLVTMSVSTLSLSALVCSGVAPMSSITHAATMGGPVTAFASWGSSEKTDFQAILKYCDANYHTKTTYVQSGPNYAAELATKVQGNNAPDVGFLSTPSSIGPYVTGGALKPLTFLDQNKLKANYAPFWRNLGTFNSKLYAVYMKADVKSLVWYAPKKFAAGHYTIPKTYDQLVALSDQMVKDGKHPWAFGINGSEWTLTDFLENVYLQSAGPAMYDKWVAHTIKWTDPSVKNAFQIMHRILGNDAYIAGGRARALGQKFSSAADQVVNDPQAEFYQEATFIGAILRGDLPKAVEGVDYSAFPFPLIGNWPVLPAEVGPNGVVMFNDTPGARALVTCLTDPNALAQWAKLGGFISPNNATPLSAYPDALTRSAATLMIKAGKANLLRGDASDLMPASLGGTYEGTALAKFFQNPNINLDSFLQDLETHAARSYAGH